MKNSSKLVSQIMVFAVLLISVQCSKDGVEEEQPKETSKGEVEVVDSLNNGLPVDPGEIGLVINAREIFRRGYTATTAKVEFPDYSKFDAELDIDAVTNVAVLSIPNEDLLLEEKQAFDIGVAMNIQIYDANNDLLEEYQNDKQVLDDTNDPLTISTQLAFLVPPVILKENIPYYVQPKEINGEGSYEEGSVLNSRTPRLYNFKVLPEVPDYRFDFYFKPTDNSGDTYYILRGDPTVGPRWYLLNDNGTIDVTENEADALVFELIQDEDGWIQIREKDTNNYITVTEGTSSPTDYRKALRLLEGTKDYFRFISADIEWSSEDRGTDYSPSIMPPAKIDFAYAAVIKNCGPGLLTEVVGTDKERSSTRTIETQESLQLFSGATASLGYKVGVSAGASIPSVGDVSASVEYSAGIELSLNTTIATENTFSNQNVETTSVSRTRTLEVPPYSAIEVFDAVRVVKNAKVPFTQKIRLRGRYSDGSILTGGEIRTQMMVNFVGGVPIAVGADYVDIGIRGTVTINEMFETETGVDEIVDGCN